MQTVEYRPALWNTLAYLLFFAVAAGGCAWMAARPNVGFLERGVGIVGSILFGAMALVVLYATIRFRAYLRLDEEGIRMVDRFGRLRLDVPWSNVANAYEAEAGQDTIVVLVASDIPSNLGKGLRAPVGLTGPDGESLGYGYIVNPSIVDVRPPDLIGQVQQRLQDRLADWDPQDGDGEPSRL